MASGIDHFPSSAPKLFARCKPIYVSLPAWQRLSE